MFRRFMKTRAASHAAPVNTRFESQSANFGLFGLYVRSLPKFGR